MTFNRANVFNKTFSRVRKVALGSEESRYWQKNTCAFALHAFYILCRYLYLPLTYINIYIYFSFFDTYIYMCVCRKNISLNFTANISIPILHKIVK